MQRYSSVIAIGNPIVDITGSVERSLVEKYKLEYGACVFINDENKGIFEEIEKTNNVSYVPGGSIENSIRACSWVLHMDKQFQGKVTMLGCTGEDAYKQKIVDALTEAKVNPLFQIYKEENTSRCACAITDRERSLVCDIKASNHLSPEFIEQNMEEIMSHDVLLLEGYFLVEQYEICKKLADQFTSKNKPVAITLSSVYLIKNNPEKIIEMSNKSDLIFCNLEECETVAGKKGETVKETMEIVHKKLNKRDRKLIVTNGKEGVIISKYNYEQDKLSFIMNAYPDLLKKEEIIDTNGAGDSFLGGYMAAFMLGYPVTACAQAGNSCSGNCLKHTGCNFDKDYVIKIHE